MELSPEIKNILLKIARNKISAPFDRAESIKIDTDEYPILKSKSGAFVTLTLNGELRGCIGYIIASKPLIKTIEDAAEQAAFHDPRFWPLREKELELIKIEISVLSEPFPMNSYDDIVLGEHGLILNEAGSRALLLPQVPIEHGMDKEEYLSSLCQKGGFSKNLWREKQLNLDAFTATVFSETN